MCYGTARFTPHKIDGFFTKWNICDVPSLLKNVYATGPESFFDLQKCVIPQKNPQKNRHSILK